MLIIQCRNDVSTEFTLIQFKWKKKIITQKRESELVIARNDNRVLTRVGPIRPWLRGNQGPKKASQFSSPGRIGPRRICWSKPYMINGQSTSYYNRHYHQIQHTVTLVLLLRQRQGCFSTADVSGTGAGPAPRCPGACPGRSSPYRRNRRTLSSRSRHTYHRSRGNCCCTRGCSRSRHHNRSRSWDPSILASVGPDWPSPSSRPLPSHISSAWASSAICKPRPSIRTWWNKSPSADFSSCRRAPGFLRSYRTDWSTVWCRRPLSQVSNLQQRSFRAALFCSLAWDQPAIITNKLDALSKVYFLFFFLIADEFWLFRVSNSSAIDLCLISRRN